MSLRIAYNEKWQEMNLGADFVHYEQKPLYEQSLATWGLYKKSKSGDTFWTGVKN